jgi:C-terminal processing protease CtpA/Prc
MLNKTLLAVAAGLLLCGPTAFAAQQKDDKKPDPPQVKDKEKDPFQGEKKAEPVDLRTRLKKYEEELFKVRQAMLQECDAELRKIDEAFKKAKEDLEKANKARDRAASSRAYQEMNRLQVEKIKVGNVRGDIERRVHVHKEVPRPVTEQHLGLTLSPVGGALRQQLGLAKDQGLLVEQVMAESPASRAGLRQFDILIQVNGQPVKSSTTAFRKTLTDMAPGAEVEVVVLRQGKQETLKGLKLPPAQFR